MKLQPAPKLNINLKMWYENYEKEVFTVPYAEMSGRLLYLRQPWRIMDFWRFGIINISGTIYSLMEK